MLLGLTLTTDSFDTRVNCSDSLSIFGTIQYFIALNVPAFLSCHLSFSAVLLVVVVIAEVYMHPNNC